MTNSFKLNAIGIAAAGIACGILLASGLAAAQGIEEKPFAPSSALSAEDAAEVHRAQNVLAEAIKKDPKNDVLWKLLAMTKYETGDVKGMLEDLKKAVSIDPKNASLWKNLGFVKSKIGDETGAQGAFEKAAFLAPTDAWTNFMLGLIYEKQKRLSDAARVYQICSQNAARDAIKNVCIQHLNHVRSL